MFTTQPIAESTATNDSDLPRKPKRIPSLDGLRAVSILLVLLSNTINRFPTPLAPYAHLFQATAYFGVTVFFVISGFLITSLLLREREREGRINLRAFFVRRIARILPAAGFYIAVVLIVGHARLKQALLAVTFMTSYAFGHAYLPLQHLWSLSVEEQFYLLWPLAFAAGLLTARRYCWAVIAIAPICRLIFVHGEYLHLFPCVADSLAFGCLLAFFYPRIKSFAITRLSSPIAFSALCAGTLGLACAIYDVQRLVLLWTFVPASIALITLIAIERQDYILNCGAIRAIGLMSYSLYLWQQPFLAMPGPYDTIPARLILCCAMACISYFLVEKPGVRLASKFNSAPLSGPAPGSHCKPPIRTAMFVE